MVLNSFCIFLVGEAISLGCKSQLGRKDYCILHFMPTLTNGQEHSHWCSKFCTGKHHTTRKYISLVIFYRFFLFLSRAWRDSINRFIVLLWLVFPCACFSLWGWLMTSLLLNQTMAFYWMDPQTIYIFRMTFY